MLPLCSDLVLFLWKAFPEECRLLMQHFKCLHAFYLIVFLAFSPVWWSVSWAPRPFCPCGSVTQPPQPWCCPSPMLCCSSCVTQRPMLMRGITAWQPQRMVKIIRHMRWMTPKKATAMSLNIRTAELTWVCFWWLFSGYFYFTVGIVVSLFCYVLVCVCLCFADADKDNDSKDIKRMNENDVTSSKSLTLSLK